MKHHCWYARHVKWSCFWFKTLIKFLQDRIMIPAWYSSTLRFHFRNGLKVDSYLRCSINLACNVEIIAYQTFRRTLWMKPYFFRNMSFYVTNRMSRFCLALKVYFLNKLLFPWEKKLWISTRKPTYILNRVGFIH